MKIRRIIVNVENFVSAILGLAIFLISFTGCVVDKHAAKVKVKEEPKVETRTIISDKCFIIYSEDGEGTLLVNDSLGKEELKEVKFYICIDKISSAFFRGKCTKDYKKQAKEINQWIKVRQEEREWRRQNPTAWRFEDRTIQDYDD